MLLTWQLKKKKDNNGKNCHEKQKHFSPFLLYVEGMLGNEAIVVLANLSQLMEAKMEKPISHVRGWVNGQFGIMVARFYSHMVHGACLPSPLRERDPD